MKEMIRNRSGVVLERDLPVALSVYAALNASRALMLLVVWPAIAALEDPKTKGAGKFLSRKEGCVMAWGGLRGAISLALAIVVTHDYHGEDAAKARGAQLLFHVAVQAFLTLAVNGATAGPLLGRWASLTRASGRSSCGDLWPAPPGARSLRGRESSTNNGLSYTTRLVASISEDDLLVAARTMFLRSWRSTGASSRAAASGSAVAEWLLSSTDLALDHAETALDDFSF
ncbi:potassium:proton antiporter [Aureococcus anophagefferens]|nr:potassium:proton antiporter [Aureococcus anophagefferens]